MKPRTTALVTVASFRDPWEARIAAGLLQSEEILVFVIHENHIWMNWPISQALGGVKLQVPLQVRLQAMQVLDGLKKGEYSDLLEGYEPVYDTRPCPRCQSGDFKPVFSVRGWLSLLIIWICLGIIFPARRRLNSCRRCSYIWEREIET